MVSRSIHAGSGPRNILVAGILPAVARASCPRWCGRDAPTTAAGTVALHISSSRKMIVDILLGRNRNAILGGWGKLPFLQRREHPVVDGRAEAVKHYLLHNRSLLVNRDFDDDVALDASGVGTKHGIRRNNRQSRANFRASGRPIGERSVERPCRRTVRPNGRGFITDFKLWRGWRQAMCVCIFLWTLPGKARLRLFLRNSGVAPEINAGQRTARLAFHDRRGSHKDWSRAVQKPCEKDEMQRQ